MGSDITLFIPHIRLLKTCCLHYPQCTLATKWHHLPGYMQHPQKVSCFIALYILYDLWLVDSSCCYDSMSFCCVLFCIHSLLCLFWLFSVSCVFLPLFFSFVTSPVLPPHSPHLLLIPLLVSMYLVCVLPALLVCSFHRPSVLLVSSPRVSRVVCLLFWFLVFSGDLVLAFVATLCLSQWLVLVFVFSWFL